MNSDDQREVIAFLSTPEPYGSRLPIERIDTHISGTTDLTTRVYRSMADRATVALAAGTR